MKKIRYIPYGYTMRNGRTVISTEEAEVIRDIFKAYLNGASLKAIAEELTAARSHIHKRPPHGIKPVSQESSTTLNMLGLKNTTPS